MKRKIAIAALTLICLSVSIPGTAAYAHHCGTARNVITSGNIRIALHEMSRTDTGQLVAFQNPDKVLPGQSISKIVTVSNTGGNTAYVRLLLNTHLLTEHEHSPDPSLIQLDLNLQDWTLHDGAYYYNYPLGPGEQTSPLFTRVFFSPQIGTSYQGSTTAITVRAEAVQAAHNDDCALTALGWPKA